MESKNLPINKVAQSGLVVIDPALFYKSEAYIPFDLKPFLVNEMVLMENHFRSCLSSIDISDLKGKKIAVFCSVDTIIPKWAYMLIAAQLNNIASDIQLGTLKEVTERNALKSISQLDVNQYRNQKIVLKGCGEIDIPASIYLALSQKLIPIVKSLMFGEPCSTVPVFKNKSL